MELFSIIVMNPSEPYSSTLTQNIFKELQQLHKNKRVFELRYELQGPYTKITGSTTLPEEHKKLIEEQMIEGIAYAIADHIINEHESEIIMELIKKELKLDSQEDIEQVEGYCKQFLNEQEDLIITGIDSATRRRTLIVNQIQLYMQEHTGFNLEGLIRFRLQDYMEELREIVEYAMDEFMMDRQYQEFISLLKYFVYIQEAKIPTAHLIHKGGHEFVILNDELEPINTSEFDSSFKLEVLDKDINLSLIHI